MTRLASTTIAVTLAVALVTLVGCATPDAPAQSPGSEPSATPEPSAETATSEPAPSDGAVEIDTSDWLSFATDDGEIAFRHPSDWTLETTTTDPVEGVGSSGSRRMDAVELTAPNGQMLLGVHDFVDVGGACGTTAEGEPDVERLEILATEPLEAAPFPTRIASIALASSDGRWTFGVGLVDPVSLERTESCFVSLATGSSEGGIAVGTTSGVSIAGDDPLWTVDTLDDARAYMETEEHATLLEILRSMRLS